MIIIDSDFFSSLAKTNELALVKKAFPNVEICIPSTVYKEIKLTPFFEKCISYLTFSSESLSVDRFIRIVETNINKASSIIPSHKIYLLGEGEIGCLVLGEKTKDHAILMDDRIAGGIAKEAGLRVVTLPAFLYFCKLKCLLTLGELESLVKELKSKDNYQFAKSVEKILLKQLPQI